MFCSKCGNENPNDSQFCSKCGVKLNDSTNKETKETVIMDKNKFLTIVMYIFVGLFVLPIGADVLFAIPIIIGIITTAIFLYRTNIKVYKIHAIVGFIIVGIVVGAVLLITIYNISYDM